MTSSSPSELVAVTGAGGFIGSHLLRRLAALGHRSRGHLGPPDQVGSPAPAGVDTLVGSLPDPELAARLCDGADVVIHVAGPPSVAASFSDPTGCTRAHAEGTAGLVAAAEAAGVRRFVLVSSAEVYGRPTTNPVAEDAPCLPRSPYAAAKVAAEAAVGAAARRGAFDAVVTRPFLVYGPGMAPHSLVRGLLDQAARGEPLAVADPRPIRDLVHVDDVVDALATAATVTLPGALTLNLCSGRAITVGEIAAAVAQLHGDDRPITNAPLDRPAAADITELVGDPAAAGHYLGWSASVHLFDGLADLARREFP